MGPNAWLDGDPGLKALAGFLLKGVLTYCESLHSFESGTHEIRNLFMKTAHSCILLEFLINARGESINRP